MEKSHLVRELNERLSGLPLIDAHTHLADGKLAARGLHDILLYHMAVSDLYAAGCPSGHRLTEYPGWPSEKEAVSRIKEALPYLPYVRNTSTSWGIRIVLEDLCGWKEPVTEDNWEHLHDLISERADDRAWQREVAARANIKRFVTEIARRESGVDDDILQYSLEWAFFTRCQWGEYDTALYELERSWGEFPGPPAPIGSGKRPKTAKTIRTLDDVHEAIDWYVQHMPFDRIISMATHISTDIDYRVIGNAEMADALTRRNAAGISERDIYASYVNEAFLSVLEEYGDRIVFQFSFGAEPLPHETASRLSQKTISQVAEMISRHPQLRFQCFLASLHANQSMCTLCRELPNLSLAGYWWHNFFPSTIQRIMEERLDMLPANKQVGFFSDAYCIEWAYAKSVMVRRLLAEVLADRVISGQYPADLALDTARRILYESPQILLGAVPR